METEFFLDEIKTYTQRVVKDLLLPCKPSKDSPNPGKRAADVYKMRLTKSGDAQKLAPYVIQQVITGDDEQEAGQRPESYVCLRSVFAVYYPDDEEKGSMALLALMDRFRLAILRDVVVGKQFALQKDRKVERIVYPDDTSPFFAGEIVSYWSLPAVEREVHFS